MNRRGMLAMFDAMLFMMVIMVALSVTAAMWQEPTSEGDASDALGSILSAEVRMSDLVEGGDDSEAKLSDLIALHMVAGDTDVDEYLEELLLSYAGGRGCILALTFGEHTMEIGEGSGVPAASCEMEVPVTTGGTLEARLELYPS